MKFTDVKVSKDMKNCLMYLKYEWDLRTINQVLEKLLMTRKMCQ